MESARKKITNAVIGLVVVVVALFAVDLIGSLIGFDILSSVSNLLGIGI